jgi:hypothetical protein
MRRPRAAAVPRKGAVGRLYCARTSLKSKSIPVTVRRSAQKSNDMPA